MRLIQVAHKCLLAMRFENESEEKAKKGRTVNPLTQFKKIPILPLLIALALVARAAGTARAAISDFNGDGHPDYVLQNACTHQTAIWYLNNNVYIGSAWGPTLRGWLILVAAGCNRYGYGDDGWLYSMIVRGATF